MFIHHACVETVQLGLYQRFCSSRVHPNWQHRLSCFLCDSQSICANARAWICCSRFHTAFWPEICLALRQNLSHHMTALRKQETFNCCCQSYDDFNPFLAASARTQLHKEEKTSHPGLHWMPLFHRSCSCLGHFQCCRPRERYAVIRGLNILNRISAYGPTNSAIAIQRDFSWVLDTLMVVTRRRSSIQYIVSPLPPEAHVPTALGNESRVHM